MDKLATVSRNELQETVGDVSDGKAAKRAMIALAYKGGVSVATLSERYGIPQSTVYYWLDRFEELPVEEALRDEGRPGRPPELTQNERANFHADLRQSPDAFDFDSETWTTGMVRDHTAEKYGVTYSDGHDRRLLRSFADDLD